MNISLLFAALAMFMWGISDVTLKSITNKFDSLTATVYKFVPHALFLGIFFLIFDPRLPSKASTWYLILLFGIVGAIALICFVTAIKKGAVSIAVAVAHLNVILTSILAAIFFGERLTFIQYMSAGIILIGMVMVTVDFKKLRMRKIQGIGYALCTAVGWGVIYAVLKPITLDVGPFAAAFYTDFLVVLLLTAYYLVVRKKKVSVSGKNAFLIVSSGLAGSIAAASTALAFYNGLVTVSMAIIVAAPVVTLVLAFIFLKERVSIMQTFGILTIVCGLVFISI